MNDFAELFEAARTRGASDVFISAGKAPRCRINGVLERMDSEVPGEAEIAMFRKQCLGNREEDYIGRGAFDRAFNSPAGGRFRINFFSTHEGSAMAVRPLADGNSLELKALELPEKLLEFCCAPRGLILATGSTGSGKSTTLGALINHINTNFAKHILTLENPIEFVHRDVRSIVSQREIDFDTPDFTGALRSALRENPDVIMVGEIRDVDGARAAIDAALTGHLVMATVHTADAVQTVERIIALFPEVERQETAERLALALNAVISQRLVPGADGRHPHPALEILVGTPTVRRLIARLDYRGLEDALIRNGADGMVPFNRAIFKLYKLGLVKLEDAMFASDNRDEFNLMVNGMARGVDTFCSRYGSGLDEGDFVDLKMLLRSAVKNGASDLILSAGSSPAVRLNGELVTMELPPMSDSDIRRMLFGLISSRQRIELETQKELDFALSVPIKLDGDTEEKSIRFRVNCFYQRGTLGAVARVVNAVIPTPEELTLPSSLVNLADKMQGLILITGPTGSGKSTTMASLLDRINRTRPAHIITIEDPIEFVHDNLMSIVEQRELHSDTPSFSSALKYALRQAPDVIMVGEMRDVETMAAALTAAETGHLVMATVHTNSAAQTVDRIVDSFPAAHQPQIKQQLASVLLGVVSQRLVPKRDGDGRAAAFEVMINTPPVQNLIREGKTFQIETILQTGAKDGMSTMENALEKLVKSNIIAPAESKKFRLEAQSVKKF